MTMIVYKYKVQRLIAKKSIDLVVKLGSILK